VIVRMVEVWFVALLSAELMEVVEVGGDNGDNTDNICVDVFPWVKSHTWL
jgi:hypothetical protein